MPLPPPGLIYMASFTGYTQGMPERNPRTSVVVPVLHEEDGIRPLAEHVLSLPSPGPVELIVVDGDPAGSTLQALGHGGHVGLISCPGRAVQMNAGARAATGEAVVFLHADTRLPGRALRLIAETLESGRVGGAFDLEFDSGDARLRLIAAAARLRSRLTRAPFGDQAQFFRRDYFLSIGGYAGMPIMEDVEIMRRIRRRGDKIVILGDRAVTSARRYHSDGVWRRVLRNWSLQAAYMAGASPEKLARAYRFTAKEDG